jgi:hypothetical protein
MPYTRITSKNIENNTIDTVDIKDGAVTVDKINIDKDLSANGHKITGLANPTDNSDAATKAYVDAHTGNQLPPATSGQTLRYDGTAWVADSNLYNDGTNIGIGTINPGSKLDVSGTVQLRGAADKTGLYVDSNGNVGIGSTNTMNSLLFIRNSTNTKFTLNIYPYQEPNDNSSNSAAGPYIPKGTALLFNAPIESALDNGRMLIYFTQPNSSGIWTGAYIGSVVGDTPNGGSHIVFGRRTGANTWAETVRIDKNGNVGIGTTAPHAKLDVNGIGIMSGDDWGIRLRSTDDKNRMHLGWYSSRNRMEISTWNEINGWESVPLAIMSNTVSFSGNVGIGTTNPSEKLHVVGNIGISAGTNAFIGTKDNYALSLRTNNTDRIYITNNGNVGIGTTSPGAKLHISGTETLGGIINSSRIIVGGNGGDAMLHLMETTDGWNIRHKASDNTLRFSNVLAGTDWVTFTENGNVGIGITSPTEKLDIVGNIRLSGNLLIGNGTSGDKIIIANNADTNKPKIRYNDTNKKWEFTNDGTTWNDIGSGGGTPGGTNTQIQFNDNGTFGGANIYYDKITGNVGIGTTSPSEKFDVVGNIGLKGYLKQEFPTSNLSATGIIIPIIAGENLSAGDVLKIGVDGKYYKAHAAYSEGGPAVALAIKNINVNSTGKALVKGYWLDTSKNYQVGGELYLSTTIGGITQTQPTSDGNIIQKIGIALTNNLIEFNPAQLYMEYKSIPYRVNLTNVINDYPLQVGEEAYIAFTNATSVPLHIQTQSGTYYELKIITSNNIGTSGGVGNNVYLNPNNTTYANAFNGVVIYFNYNDASSSSFKGTFNSFRIGWAIVDTKTFIINYTTHKTIRTLNMQTGTSAGILSVTIESCVWNDTTTPWTSLGTITFPQSTSGYILIRRLQ